MDDYVISNGKIYPRVDEIDPKTLLSQRDSLIASKGRADAASVDYQSQIDAIDSILKEVNK